MSDFRQIDETVIIDINLNEDSPTLKKALEPKQDKLVNTVNIKSINGESILGSGDLKVAESLWEIGGAGAIIKTKEKRAIDAQLTTIGQVADPILGNDAVNLTYFRENVKDFQIRLVNQENIKSINNQSLLGSGNINITGGDSIWEEVDNALISPIKLVGIDIKKYPIVNLRDPENDTDAVPRKYVDEKLSSYQEKLVNQTNIKSINNQSLLGSGNIDIQLTPQFTDDEVNRLKLLLSNTAFGYNKVTEELQHKGFFTEQVFYNDLDKPDDNIVTDKVGNDLDIRKVMFIHYSGTGTYKENGKDLGLRYYQDKYTYNGGEVSTVTQIPDVTKGFYLSKVTGTGSGTRMFNVNTGLKTGVKYWVELTWANNKDGNHTFIPYIHMGQSNNTDLQRYIVSSVAGLLPNVIALSNNFGNGFKISAVIGTETTSGFIFNVYEEVPFGK